MRENNQITGVANCIRLHIHAEPNLESEIVCKVRYLTELVIDESESTDEFYKVYIATGAEGFCEKDYVTIKR